MTRNMEKVGACKPSDEESGIPHSHPDEWAGKDSMLDEREDSLNAGKSKVGRGVAAAKDYRKDGGAGEGY
jgi:hypothetical protein